MAFVLQGLRRAAAAGSAWSAQGTRFMRYVVSGEGWRGRGERRESAASGQPLVRPGACAGDVWLHLSLRVLSLHAHTHTRSLILLPLLPLFPHHSSSSSLNRLPAQITAPSTSVSPSSLQVLLQRVFPLGRPTTNVITTKPTLVVGSPAEIEGFECLNRNARRGKKANHGKRPVSSARRKQKHRTFGRKNG